MPTDAPVPPTDATPGAPAPDDVALPDDQIPEDAVDGVDPTEGDPSARSEPLPPEAQ